MKTVFVCWQWPPGETEQTCSSNTLDGTSSSRVSARCPAPSLPGASVSPGALRRFSLAFDRVTVQKGPSFSFVDELGCSPCSKRTAQWTLVAASPPGKPVSEGMLGLDPPPPTPELVSARPIFDLTGSAVVALSSSPVTIRAPAQPGPAVEVVGYQDG